MCAGGKYVMLSFFFSSIECRQAPLLAQQTIDQYPS